MTKEKEVELPKRKFPKYEEKQKKFHLECRSFDEELIFAYPNFNRDDDYDVFFITHRINTWYAYQQPIRGYFRRLFSMLWCAIANKEYTFYEIVLDKSQFKEFKKWVRGL